jgi:hypothetical protein
MKTLPKEQPFIEQEVISKKIEEMLSVLEKRNKLITRFYKSMLASGSIEEKSLLQPAEKTTLQ